MTITIRRMRPDDSEIEALAALRHAVFFAGSDRTLDVERAELSAFARRNGADEIGLVAIAGDVIAGCCLFVPHELEEHHDVGPWLAGLVVAEDFRNRGVGSGLVRAIEDEASNCSIARLYLYTSGAEAFYAALGWNVLDRFVDDAGDASTLMARDLAKQGLI